MSNNAKINLSAIINNEKYFIYTPNDSELQNLANTLSVPKVNNLLFKCSIHKQDMHYVLKGTLETSVEQLCSTTGEELQVEFQIDIFRKYKVVNNGKQKDNSRSIKEEKNYIFLTKSLNKIDDEDIDTLENYTLNILDIIQEELLLNINPYIKKTI